MSYSVEDITQGYLGDVTMLPHLQLRCRLSNAQAAELCFVSPETYRRWRADRRPNPLAVRFLAVLAGYMPWAGWQDWQIDNGHLFAPGYLHDGFSTGDILAMHFIRQEVRYLRRQVIDLKAELARIQRPTRRVLRQVP